MSPLSSFAQYAVDLLASVGPVRARAMFGGYGLSLDGISIGLIDDDRLYLRTDELNRAEFQAAGSEPFVYQSRNGPMTMTSYWALPEDSVDDPEKASRWGRLAAEAARRADAAKKAKKKAPRVAQKAKAKAKAAARSAAPKKAAPRRRRA
ncbi:MAG TPA: TfoX/Sxy family protein [Myxococcales bacterium]|nr:TfoX/Sxy family protein [Myxococcales bacterium]